MNEALSYLEITNGVNQLVADHCGNDKTRAASLVMRAAMLVLKTHGGVNMATTKARQLADEIGAT